MRVAITPQENARLTRAQVVNPDAYNTPARGHFSWNTFTAEGFNEAIKYYQKASEIAPDYALAYAGLADVYRTLPFYSPIDPRDAFPKARAAANKALQLDETLAEAYTTLGWTTSAYEWNWQRAEQYFRRALELKDQLRHGAHDICLLPGLGGKVRGVHRGRPARSRAGSTLAADHVALGPNVSLSAGL